MAILSAGIALSHGVVSHGKKTSIGAVPKMHDTLGKNHVLSYSLKDAVEALHGEIVAQRRRRDNLLVSPDPAAMRQAPATTTTSGISLQHQWCWCLA